MHIHLLDTYMLLFFNIH